MIPSLEEIADGRITVSMIRDVQIEDLLGREPVNLDRTEVAAAEEEDEHRIRALIRRWIPECRIAEDRPEDRPAAGPRPLPPAPAAGREATQHARLAG